MRFVSVTKCSNGQVGQDIDVFSPSTADYYVFTHKRSRRLDAPRYTCFHHHPTAAVCPEQLANMLFGNVKTGIDVLNCLLVSCEIALD